MNIKFTNQPISAATGHCFSPAPSRFASFDCTVTSSGETYNAVTKWDKTTNLFSFLLMKSTDGRINWAGFNKLTGLTFLQLPHGIIYTNDHLLLRDSSGSSTYVFRRDLPLPGITNMNSEHK
ncbi:hypothetical protein DN068_12445 [Taibaiella soli]|uniref:Uncharacterized protein n=1 Tax=Taibaiella soli TaxID=1649169 RepID=A0A2W2AYA5_9BACT|nr:hypothetical protein DN068_12445 [Taibaiella soli]